MKHSVIFDSCDNHWDNAIPLGNGIFGCMLFYERNRLYMPLNHYEVYYNRYADTLPSEILASQEECTDPGAYHIETRERADRNQPPEGEPFCLYRSDRAIPSEKRGFASEEFAETHPLTGELNFDFAPALKDAKQNFTLYLEDAKAVLKLAQGDAELTMDTIVAREDLIINSVCQSKENLIKSVTVVFPLCRSISDVPELFYEQVDKNTVVYTAVRKLSEKKTSVFSGVIRFDGAEVSLENKGELDACITITKSNKEFRIFTSIFTDYKYNDPKTDGLKKMEEYQKDIDSIRHEHADYWKGFFERSSVTLPDKMLEKVYYVNQYALDCCSGKDGVMKHHACGLNGLWDIRRPTLWGSLWYWDVNIQAAFAGVFSSNRLELAKVFSDGLLSYTELAEKYAHDVHNLTGISADYPYPFYYSTWPWCAQYLWFLYEYSLDKEYLKNDAYPVFIKICEFLTGLLEYDKETDTYGVYPDVSPEQGPLAHNTTITISTVKYLFEFTLKSAEILGETSEILDKCKEILSKLPAYPLTEDTKYGTHLMDSPDAPGNLWIRHPSMLMPVFPIGEYGNTEEEKAIVSNTIDFLDERCETGIFGGSWIAAAAARIGRGQTALRILYEKGIDHMLRSNGLTAEVTERFMNHCLIMRQPLYYPCMMEFTGEMLAAVNEMLIQSYNGVIKVFPALPDGDREYGRMVRNAFSITDYAGRYNEYEAWKTVRFDKLLAKGAFEISASLKDGALEWILVDSKMGGEVNLSCPYITDDMYVYCDGKKEKVSLSGGILTFATEKGKKYLVSQSEDAYTPLGVSEYDNEIPEHLTILKRKIYVGENKETIYQKKFDNFTRDRLLGDTQLSPHTVYKFDFTKEEKKNYLKSMSRFLFATEEHYAGALGFIRLGNDEFTLRKGYGFASGEGIEIVKRDFHDVLRMDFAQGTEDAEFVIEMPRGQYEILVISGDSDEESVTIATCENSRVVGGKVLEAGEFQCEAIPVISEYDEPLTIKISTKAGYKWKLNGIIVNSVRDLL